MTVLRYFFKRLRALWRPDDIHDEISEEMRFHIELRAEENVRRRMTPEEARRKAEQQFGHLDHIKEEGYDVRGGRWLEATWQDLRYGVRMLLKSKMYTLVAVLSLALGIGANTAIFSLLDAVLLKSLPVREPEKLVFFGRGEWATSLNEFPNRNWGSFSYPFYREARRLSEVFSDVAAAHLRSWTIHGALNTNGANGEQVQIEVQPVSRSYFSTLGVNASLGRLITDDDDRVYGAHPVAVVSHDWWERRLGGDPAAIGKTVTIDKIAYTIIGVAPKEFSGLRILEKQDMWIPLAMEAQAPPVYWKGTSREKFTPNPAARFFSDGHDEFERPGNTSDRLGWYRHFDQSSRLLFESLRQSELQYQRGGDQHGDKAKRKRQFIGTGAVTPHADQRRAERAAQWHGNEKITVNFSESAQPKIEADEIRRRARFRAVAEADQCGRDAGADAGNSSQSEGRRLSGV